MKQSHSHKTSKDPILVPYVRKSEPHLAKNSSAAPTSPSSSNKTLHYTSGANGAAAIASRAAESVTTAAETGKYNNHGISRPKGLHHATVSLTIVGKPRWTTQRSI